MVWKVSITAKRCASCGNYLRAKRAREVACIAGMLRMLNAMDD